MRRVLLLVFASCHEPAKVLVPATVADSGVAIATFASDASAHVASTTCVEPVLQPGSCVPAEGDMNDDAIAVWLKARGSMDDSNYEACHETTFGTEQALVCTRMGHIAIDKGLGIAGPVEFRREFVIATVRAKKRVELVVLPLDFGVGGEVVFTARFSVDKAGTLEFALGPDECAEAKKALDGWIEGQITALRENSGIEPAFKKQLIVATNLERTSDRARIDAICKATGRYVVDAKGMLTAASRPDR